MVLFLFIPIVYAFWWLYRKAAEELDAGHANETVAQGLRSDQPRAITSMLAPPTSRLKTTTFTMGCD